MSGDGRWKLHLPHSYRTLVTAGKDGQPGNYRQEKIGLSLFDMVNDPYETRNVMDAFPEVTRRLRTFAEQYRADMATR